MQLESSLLRIRDSKVKMEVHSDDPANELSKQDGERMAVLRLLRGISEPREPDLGPGMCPSILPFE